MRRLIGLFLLALAPLATMAQTDYPIHEDFRAACRITAPLGRGVLGIGNAFLTAMPKGMRSDSSLAINKIKIISTADGEKFGAWVIVPTGEDSLRPAILFLHGGGFVFKGAPYHYDLAKEYARRTIRNWWKKRSKWLRRSIVAIFIIVPVGFVALVAYALYEDEYGRDYWDRKLSDNITLH